MKSAAFLLTAAIAIQMASGGPGVLKARPDWARDLKTMKSAQNARIAPQAGEIGGTAVTPGQFPFHAFILSDALLLCGGSLIRPGWVLTIAACLKDFDKYHVHLGTVDWRGGAPSEGATATVATNDTFLHPEWRDSRNFVHNVGLLRLPSDLALSALVATVKLPGTSDMSNTFAGASAKAFQYEGTVSTTNKNLLLKWMDTLVVTNEACAAYTPFLSSYVDATYLCANHTNQNTCYGCPLVVRDAGDEWTLIGILSIPAYTPQYDELTAYMRLTAYAAWIADTIASAPNRTTTTSTSTSTSTPTTKKPGTTKKPTTTKPPKCNTLDFSELDACCVEVKVDLADKKGETCASPVNVKAVNDLVINKQQDQKSNWALNLKDSKVQGNVFNDACYVSCFNNRTKKLTREATQGSTGGVPATWADFHRTSLDACLNYVAANPVGVFKKGGKACPGTDLALAQCTALRSLEMCTRKTDSKCQARWAEFDFCKKGMFQ